MAQLEGVDKIWGMTRRIAPGTWHASIKAGGCSSEHVHRETANKFYVVSGLLLVLHAKEEIQLYHDEELETFMVKVPCDNMQLLRAGEMLVMPAMLKHQFVCLEDTELIEVYPEKMCDTEDIVRDPQQLGRVLSADELQALFESIGLRGPEKAPDEVSFCVQPPAADFAFEVGSNSVVDHAGSRRG